MGKAKQYKPIDPSTLDLITVSLEHLSSTPLSHDYDYHILYVSARMYKKVWTGSEESQADALSKISVERQPTRKTCLAETKPSLFENQARDYVFTEYVMTDGLDHCVDIPFRTKVLTNFKAFIVRSKKEAAPLPQLLINHSTRISTKYEIEDVLDGEMQVCGYQYQPVHITINGPKSRSFFGKITQRITARLSIS